MSIFPYDRSNDLRNSLLITQALGNGEQMVYNPVHQPSANVITETDNVNLQIDDIILNNPMLPLLDIQSLQSLGLALTGLGSSVGSLQGHTNTLIFGDDSDSIISGGLSANLGSAIAAINLENTLNSLNTGNTADGCDLLTSFFGSILGLGQQLLDLVSQILGSIVGLIEQGLEFLLEAIGGLLGSISSLISQITNLILSELAAFAQWLARLIDFGFSSFLSTLFNGACSSILGNAVATPNLLNILGR